MEKLENYKQIIRKVLTRYLELDRQTPEPNMEYLLVADDESGQYLWKTVGWEKSRHIDLTTVYVRLKNGKIWIEEDWTENGIAADLLREGVSKQDIVLAFHEPAMRQHTEFSAA